MDIFNCKRVAELEEELAEVKHSRDKYMTMAADLKVKLEEIGKLNETIPEDCEKGPWCKACEFVRTFHYNEYYGYGNYKVNVAYTCGKGKSCKNFVQRET